MRIVIELDGTTTVVNPTTEESTARQSMDAAADGGEAPGAAGASTPADSDGGGPSAELLDSIAAAERASGDGTAPSDSTDGGAAPESL